ncbi:MAG: HAD family hydrolase [Spirochaetales bacterium]|nr:HAD family hydrolase [Spirochaetales bacterium]
MSIKLISFDFWGTIYHNEPSLSDKQKNVILQLLQEVSIFTIGEALINEAFHSAWEKWDVCWKEQYHTLTVDEWLVMVLEYLHVEISDDYMLDYCSKLQALLFTGNTKEIPGVRSVIESLAKQYNLAIISDTGIESGKYLKNLLRYDTLNYFDYYVFSNEFGRSKPHSSVFEALLTYFNLHPEEVVHIGDSRRTDVEGAKSVGMHTIRFSGCKNDENSNYDEADFVIQDYALLPDLIENFTQYKRGLGCIKL